MRSALLFVTPALALSGCTGWVVFGHTIGSDNPPAAHSPPTQQPPPAVPPGQAAQAAQPAALEAQAAPSAQLNTMQPAAVAQVGGAPQPLPMQSAPAASTSVASVYVIVSPQAKNQIAADARFDQQKLLAAVEKELQTRRLLVGTDAAPGSASATNRRMEIDVDAFSTRASTNAVIFGYALASGELAADVRVRDGEGRELSGFPVQAKARLATRPAEEDPNPLGNLYRRFAVLTADRLAGVQSKPDESEVMPR